MIPCRLLIDPPAAGAWNMAVDEVLWNGASGDGPWCLRLYRWAEPTLSLGYFQDDADRQHHAASASCPAVRRISGGGAIVHDVELTYSLVVPARHPKAARRGRLYEAVHATIVELLAGLGIEASIHPGPESPAQQAQPFLCFQRRAAGDVLAGRFKVAGSAQRRSQLAVLQHGSLLLARSNAAPELPGLQEIARRSFAAEEIVAAWLPLLSERLGLQWVREGLSLDERGMATQLVEEKHGIEAWVRHRGRGTPSMSPDGFDTDRRSR